MIAGDYPLKWPAGLPRTSSPERARFSILLMPAIAHLRDELRLSGATLPVISTNVALRRDGLPYANAREPDDSGVAVYFTRDGRQQVIACDRWDLVAHNVRAIGKTVEALRGIERWGSSDMVRRAFTGFAALPAPSEDWRSVLDLGGGGRSFYIADYEREYRRRAAKAHPDLGGTVEEMQRLNAAIEAARKELSR